MIKDSVGDLLLESRIIETEPLKDEELLYIDLGEFARHLVELLRTHRIEEFPSVFDVIERLPPSSRLFDALTPKDISPETLRHRSMPTL